MFCFEFKLIIVVFVFICDKHLQKYKKTILIVKIKLVFLFNYIKKWLNTIKFNYV